MVPRKISGSFAYGMSSLVESNSGLVRLSERLEQIIERENFGNRCLVAEFMELLCDCYSSRTRKIEEILKLRGGIGANMEMASHLHLLLRKMGYLLLDKMKKGNAYQKLKDGVIFGASAQLESLMGLYAQSGGFFRRAIEVVTVMKEAQRTLYRKISFSATQSLYNLLSSGIDKGKQVSFPWAKLLPPLPSDRLLTPLFYKGLPILSPGSRLGENRGGNR